MLKVKKFFFDKVNDVTKEVLYGCFVESYRSLPAYVEMIKATNPVSYTLVTWSVSTDHDTPHFKA